MVGTAIVIQFQLGNCIFLGGLKFQVDLQQKISVPFVGLASPMKNMATFFWYHFYKDTVECEALCCM